MSRLFGPVRQSGYVVPDLERAVGRWLAAGVGLDRQFLDHHPNGVLQHLGFFPDGHAVTRQKEFDAGWEVGHEGRIGTIDYSYWRLPGTHEHIFEFEVADLDATQPGLFAHIDEMSRSWDGTTRPTRGDC